MSVTLTFGNQSALCSYTLTGDNFVVESETGKLTARIAVDDILSLEEKSTSNGPLTVVHFIRKLEEKRWTRSSITLCVGKDKTQYEHLVNSLRESFKKVEATRPKKLLVLINPVSGKGKSRKLYDGSMAPLFKLTNIQTKVIVSERSKHLPTVAASQDLDQYDGIVLFGGDGTYAEVVNALLQKVNQDAGVDINNSMATLRPLTKPICIVPTGTGNGASEALFGDSDVTTIALHVIRGRTRKVPAMGVYCQDKLLACSGCVQGLGFASDLFYLADKNLRCMGTARYKVAPLVYMFKPLRMFGLELTCYEKNENGDLVEKERIKKNCCMMLNWAFNACDKEDLTQKSYDSRVCCIVYTPLSKMRMMLYMMRKLMKKARDAFKQEFIEIHRGEYVDIKLTAVPESPPDCDELNRVVSVDGELFDNNPVPEYRLRMMEDLVTVFCSY